MRKKYGTKNKTVRRKKKQKEMKEERQYAIRKRKEGKKDGSFLYQGLRRFSMVLSGGRLG